MPRERRSNRRRPLYQLIEDQITHAPTSDSVQAQKAKRSLGNDTDNIRTDSIRKQILLCYAEPGIGRSIAAASDSLAKNSIHFLAANTQNVVGLDSLGFWSLELDPVAEFDRSSSMVYKLVPSNGRFEYDVDWNDTIPFRTG